MPFWTTEQHAMIRASVRRFAENEIAPTAELLDHPSDPRTRAFLTGDMVY